MNDRPICFVDTETTGLSQKARPWEIAIVRRETDGTERTLVAHVSYSLNGLPEGADPYALNVGGWLLRGVRGSAWTPGLSGEHDRFTAGTEREIAGEVLAWLSDEPVLVGVGTHFDAAMLTRLLSSAGLNPQPWHYAIVDLKTAAWGYALGGHGCGESVAPEHRAVPVKSEQIAAWMGVEPPTDADRHTALGDARWAQRWFDRLTNGPAQTPQDDSGDTGTRTEGSQALTDGDVAGVATPAREGLHVCTPCVCRQQPEHCAANCPGGRQ